MDDKHIAFSTKYLDCISLTGQERSALKRLMPFRSNGIIRVSTHLIRVTAMALDLSEDEMTAVVKRIKSKRKGYELNKRGSVFKQALKDTWESIHSEASKP